MKILSKLLKKSPPAAHSGVPLVFGIPKESRKVHGLPAGQHKLVQEIGRPALVVFMGDKMDRFFTLEDRGEFWIPFEEIKRETLL